MMTLPTITRDEVIKRSRVLPSFPGIVNQILATLNDPDASFNVLVRCISLDPVISARVLSVANAASTRGRRETEVSSIHTAVSLIGLIQVRHITLISSLGAFIGKAATRGMPVSFWEHSVAVCTCCGELASHVQVPVSTDAALVAGLLHDVGQLWLFGFDAAGAMACWRQAHSCAKNIDTLEREHFGVGHSTIGGWMAEHWALPPEIVLAIERHHDPDQHLALPLVPLVHVAEVLSNALDLTGRVENRVTSISSAACERLKLVWDDDIRPLFGRIDARSKHANHFFHLQKQSSS